MLGLVVPEGERLTGGAAGVAGPGLAAVRLAGKQVVEMGPHVVLAHDGQVPRPAPIQPSEPLRVIGDVFGSEGDHRGESLALFAQQRLTPQGLV